jgi:hypothetical protein
LVSPVDIIYKSYFIKTLTENAVIVLPFCRLPKDRRKAEEKVIAELQALGAVLLELANEDGSPFIPSRQSDEGIKFWKNVHSTITGKDLAFHAGIADLKKRKSGSALGKLFFEIYLKKDNKLLDPTKTTLSRLLIK